MSGSTDLKPTTVATTTGKKPSMNAQMTLGMMPKPNQTTNSGAIAIFGHALREHEQRIDEALDGRANTRSTAPSECRTRSTARSRRASHTW